MDEVARWDLGGELHQDVVKEWYPTFHRSCHAHAVLLHEQLDQIGFDVRIQHVAEQITGTALPEKSRVGIQIGRMTADWLEQQYLLLPLRKRAEKILKV